MHSFKFDGKNVYFSGKMMESTTYMQSVAKGELVPQITLNKLAVPEEEWTLLEMEEIMEKMFNQLYGDHTNNAVRCLSILFLWCDKNKKIFSFILV